MKDNQTPNLEAWLNSFTGDQWFQAADDLANDIHPVDRNAIRIWLRFYPLDLHRHLETSENQEEEMRKFAIQGQYELKNQIDSSHHFLYGHRYWKTVKETIESQLGSSAAPGAGLPDTVRTLASQAAEKLKVDRSLLTGITIAGLMTVVQAGASDFRNAPGNIQKPTGIMAKSPNAIVAERAKADSQGILGFL